MERLIERAVDEDLTSRLVAMALMVYSLPRPVGDVDAILVLPGQGEDWRLTAAIKAWNTDLNVKYLLVAGSYSGEKTWFEPTLENLSVEPYNLTRREGVVIHPHAHHTKEQAAWISEIVRELDINSLALVVSPYHLLRAYLTILETLLASGQEVAMVPMPAPVAPHVPIPETGFTAWQLVSGEVARINKYQQMGDVATYEQLQAYLEWLWDHPILKPHAS